MYLIVRHYSNPMTFSHEERFGPFTTQGELDEAAYSFRNSFWCHCDVEGSDGVRRVFLHSDAAERRRQ